jgi:hypothetical protein
MLKVMVFLLDSALYSDGDTVDISGQGTSRWTGIECQTLAMTSSAQP